uniref:CCHC-type domain-containing protein n=1 Tax=Strongyloides venezuelensis TaxID=75913 RepID=A0A0K0FFP4_STRVS
MLLDGKPLDDLELYPELLENYEDLIKHLQHNYNQKESRDSAARELQLHLRTKPKRINDLDEYALKLEKLVDIIERGSSKESIMRRKLDLLVDSITNKCKSKCVSVRHSTFREAVTYVKTIWNYDLTAALSTKSNNSILNRSQPPNTNGRDKTKRHENSNRKENPQVKCHGCGKIGHTRPRCPENLSNGKTSNSIIRTKPFCVENILEKIKQLKSQELIAIEVQVNDINVVALCDTGTNVVTVHPELANYLGLKKDKLIHIGSIAGGKTEKMSNQPITVNYNFKSTVIKETMIAAQLCLFSLYQLIIGNQVMKNLGIEIMLKTYLYLK